MLRYFHSPSDHQTLIYRLDMLNFLLARTFLVYAGLTNLMGRHQLHRYHHVQPTYISGPQQLFFQLIANIFGDTFICLFIYTWASSPGLEKKSKRRRSSSSRRRSSCGGRKDQIEITMADAARGHGSLPVLTCRRLRRLAITEWMSRCPRDTSARILARRRSYPPTTALARFRSSISGSCLIRSHRRRSAPGSDPHATTGASSRYVRGVPTY